MADKDEEYIRHFQNAVSNYSGVLAVLDRFPPPDQNRTMPDDWQRDPLSLLGEYLDLLNLSDEEKREYGTSTRGLVERNGVDWVWNDRCRLAAEIEFLRRF